MQQTSEPCLCRPRVAAALVLWPRVTGRDWKQPFEKLSTGEQRQVRFFTVPPYTLSLRWRKCNPGPRRQLHSNPAGRKAVTW